MIELELLHNEDYEEMWTKRMETQYPYLTELPDYYMRMGNSLGFHNVLTNECFVRLQQRHVEAHSIVRVISHEIMHALIQLAAGKRASSQYDVIWTTEGDLP